MAGAIHAGAQFLATSDRKHLLAHAVLIQTTFGIIVGTPEAVLASIEPVRSGCAVTWTG